MRQPRIELGSVAWEATMLTIIPLALERSFIVRWLHCRAGGPVYPRVGGPKSGSFRAHDPQDTPVKLVEQVQGAGLFRSAPGSRADPGPRPPVHCVQFDTLS